MIEIEKKLKDEYPKLTLFKVCLKKIKINTLWRCTPNKQFFFFFLKKTKSFI